MPYLLLLFSLYVAHNISCFQLLYDLYFFVYTFYLYYLLRLCFLIDKSFSSLKLSLYFFDTKLLDKHFYCLYCFILSLFMFSHIWALVYLTYLFVLILHSTYFPSQVRLLNNFDQVLRLKSWHIRPSLPVIQIFSLLVERDLKNP